MKVLAVSLLVIAVTMAEPPQRYRNAALNTGYGAPEEANEAPYPPSGWRPSGRQFVLPARQSSYYIPPPPPPQYGPPSTEAPTTEQPTTTEAEPTTTEAETEAPAEEDNNEFADGARAFSSASAQDREEEGSGVYYVLLPDGRLQRVAYSTNPNGAPPEAVSAPIRNAGYVQFRYMDVEPIRAPIYSYGAPLVRIF
ncbi:uncharacterized protein [Anabrus simplex]|uniref:uncharacterized protein n=1 Tax=Anabrus simplex TaxID=316456 RepID=UPI0035A29105